jgi:hypothetical protein
VSTLREQADYENARWLKEHGFRIVADPGPLPRERADSERRRGQSFPRNEALVLSEAAERAWVELVALVRATNDRDANRALGAFHVALQAFLSR